MSAAGYKFVVQRDKRSYQFKADLNAPDLWDDDHNAKNNMIDRAFLFDPQGKTIWSALMQTVANMPGVRHTDTIVPGRFSVIWDVEPRAFKGHIHGIFGAVDQDGQFIDSDSVERVATKDGAPTDWARWIFGHSTRKNAPAADGDLTRYAWSAGCFITSPESQDALWAAGVAAGFVKNDQIDIELIEVATPGS